MPTTCKRLVWPCLAFLFLLCSVAVAAERYSSLSDGKFEVQLERPDIPRILVGSREMDEALAGYKTLPFNVGERIRYVVTYLGIKGGMAELVLQHPVQAGSVWAHRATAEVLSADWYKWVFAMHDALESIFSGDGTYAPFHFYINQREGRFYQTKVIRFDREKGVVFQKQQRKGKKLKDAEFPYEEGTKDAIGALYFLRAQLAAAESGLKDFDFQVFTSEQTWLAQVRKLREESREVEGQTFQTDVYALDTQFGGLLQQEGDIRIWFTKDSRALPVYIQANVAFGYIEVALTEWDQGYVTFPDKKKYPPIRP